MELVEHGQPDLVIWEVKSIVLLESYKPHSILKSLKTVSNN